MNSFSERLSAWARHVRTVSADAMTLLVHYEWPGNVRELEHGIERAVILARGTTVTIRDLPPEIALGRPGIRPTETLDLKENEQRLIRQALEKFKGTESVPPKR